MATSARSYTSLEPSYFNDIGIEKSPTFDTQQAVSLFASTSFLYTLGIMIAVVAAGFMYVRAGLIRMKPSEQAVSESNAMIKRTTLGLLGVLCLFVIIYTFNPDLLTGNVSLSSLKSSPFKSGMGGDFGGGGASGGFEVPTTNGNQVGASEQANRQRLSAAGISINKNPCIGSDTNCTNVGGINPKTIDLLLKVRADCSCTVQVTGGTEPGHSANSNHGVGKEAVDISLTTDLFNFIKKNGTPVGANRYGWGGFIFWDEAPGSDSSGNANSARHFHASFTGR